MICYSFLYFSKYATYISILCQRMVGYFDQKAELNPTCESFKFAPKYNTPEFVNAITDVKE